MSLVALVKAADYSPDIVILLTYAVTVLKVRYKNLDTEICTWNIYVYFM